MRAEARAPSPSAEFECATCGAHLDPLHLDVASERASCSFCGTPQDVVVATDPPSPRSLDVGETLRRGRETRGETLEQAAQITRIRRTYLRDLEHGDIQAFDPYPGRVYARFFLREYAGYLGLEPGPLVRRFDASPDPVVVPMPPRPKQARPPHPRRWAVGATLLLIALLVVGSVAARDGREPDAVAAPPRAVVDPQPPSREPPTPPPADDTSVHAVIELSRDCWILAIVDGEAVRQETVPAGETVRLRADRRMELRLGDAGAAELTVNGRSVRTGASGAIVDLAFALRDGRVVSV